MTDLPPLPPELEPLVEAEAIQLRTHIEEALERVNTAPEYETRAMCVSFMALIDHLGEDVATTTVAEFMFLFQALFLKLTGK